LLAWLHSTLEPKRRLRLSEGELSAFVTSIADRLLAGALDDGSSVTGRSLKEFFTRAGPEASLDFLRKRHLTHNVAVWLLDAACRGRAGQLQDKGASPRVPKSRGSGVEEGLVVSRKAPTEDAGSQADDSAAQFDQTPGSKEAIVEMAGADEGAPPATISMNMSAGLCGRSVTEAAERRRGPLPHWKRQTPEGGTGRAS
jgi:hypothetical protein